MKVAIYIRVSSTEQADDGYSIGAQQEKLTAYCKAKDWNIYKVYSDPGFTGANIKRPAMQEMIADIKSHKLDAVVVYKLDRFTRSQKDCITMLEDVLIPNDCDFVSISENFDTTTPYGRAMIGILSVFAQLERETIRERTVMGRIERAKTGLYSGNANLPIGYDYVDGRLVVNEYEAMQVKEIFELYNSGFSINKILDFLNEKGYTNKHGEWKHLNTIKRILASKLYHGELKYKGKFYEAQHEPIITKETYEKAQQVHKHYSETATGHRKTPFMSTHLLTGLLWCGECGARMHGKTITRNGGPQYICYSKSKVTKKYIMSPYCDSKTWNCEEIEAYVLDSICKLDFKTIKDLQKNSTTESDSTAKEAVLKQQLDQISKKTNKLMDLYLMDGIEKDLLSNKLSDLQKQSERINKELSSLNKEKTISPKEVICTLHSFDKIIYSGTLEQKKAFLNSLIDRIVVYNDKIVIHWTFI